MEEMPPRLKTLVVNTKAARDCEEINLALSGALHSINERLQNIRWHWTDHSQQHADIPPLFRDSLHSFHTEEWTKAADRKTKTWSKSADMQTEEGSQSADRETEEGRESTDREADQGRESAYRETKQGREPTDRETEQGRESADRETEEGGESADSETEQGRKSSERQGPTGAEDRGSMQQQELLSVMDKDEVLSLIHI